MIRVIAFAFLFSIGVYPMHGQPASNFSPATLVAAGDEEILKGQYYNALGLYEKAYKEVKDRDILVRIARTNLLLRDYAKAAVQLQRVLARDKSNKYIEDRFLYARALKMNGNFEDAAKEFQAYIASGTNPELKSQAELELQGIALRAGMKENVAIQVKNAGATINTAETQSSPAFDREGTLYFGSLIVDEPNDGKGVKKSDGKKAKPVEDEEAETETVAKQFSALYSSTYLGDKGWSKSSPLPELINREGYHTSNVSFSGDGNTMYFTRVISDGGFMEESKIYLAVKTAAGWSPAIEATGVNGDYLARHPYEGELYGSKVLFFSANIPGGKGGFDIYYAKKIGEGEFEAPINIGSVNTTADDITPFYTEGKLYFSSEGWPSIGGFDVFVSQWNGTGWSQPENMGMPINSSADDLYYRKEQDREIGLIVSNRIAEGAKSLKSKTCCDDIYFVSKRTFSIELENLVFDEAKKPIKGATAQLIEMQAGRDGSIQSKTNSDGNDILFSLDKDKSYKVVVSKDGYFPSEIQLNTVGITQDQKLKRNFTLRRLPPESDIEIITINEPIRLNNIYYDFDDDKILPDAEKDLAFVKDLLDKYPDMVIELGSHTDARGNDSYNQKLSQRRAASARRWLIKRGIAEDRIVAKGYGEDVILNHCTNGEECSDEEHRFNRRTEFKIIKGPTTIEVKKEVLNKKAKPQNKG